MAVKYRQAPGVIGSEELRVGQRWRNLDGETVAVSAAGPTPVRGLRPVYFEVVVLGCKDPGFTYSVMHNGAAFDADWVPFPGGTLVCPLTSAEVAGKEAQLHNFPKEGESESNVVRVPKAPAAPDLLEAAAKHMRDRAETYDTPEGERSMAQTVAVFNEFHGTGLSEAQGWHFMQILKDVRLFANGGFHQDSAEDGTAYSALKGEAKAREVQP